MYWNSNPSTSSHLETLLNKKDLTLQEIMDDEGVLQECKSQNKHLIDYLIRSDVLEKLVCLTTEEPPGDEDDVVKYKYPNIACELLTSEIPQLSESLANNEALLTKLYSFLDADAPLNPLLASFFSKTLSMLITRNSEQNWYSYQITCLKVLEFLKLKENSMALLLKHLGTSAIMDLVFKLIIVVEDSEIKDNILNWLDEQKLVENLVALLDPSIDSLMHYNAAQLLCDVIRTSRSNKMQVSPQSPEPNKILERIESPEIVSLLLDFILKEPKCETSIVGGISVLLTLLEDKCSNGGRYAYEESTQDNTNHLKVVASTTKAILPRLKDFHDILINPPFKQAVKTTITVLEPPLGNTRIEVAKLLSVLVSSNNEEINKELAELDTVNVLLDLFFKYTWNNFLHTQVQKFLAFALNADCSATEGGDIQKNGLIAHILSKCHLIQRILDAWQDNEIQQTEHKRPRRGYMGHLIKIANSIFQCSQSHSFGALMKETVDNETLDKWDNFVSTKLAEIHKNYTIYLSEDHTTSNDKNGEDGKTGSYGDFSQQLYSNYYQLQALAPTFAGEFGSFQESQFNDDEDVLNSSANPNFQKINFKVSEEDADQQAVFFEKVCAQKFQTLDDYNGYVWDQDSASVKGNENTGRDWQGFESSSSDEEDVEANLNSQKDGASLDFNSLPEWPDCSDVPPAESLNPWESSNANTVSSPDLGWANFDSVPFVPDFGSCVTTPDINSTLATSTSCEASQDSYFSENNRKLKKEDWEEICKLKSMLKNIDFNKMANEIVTEKSSDCRPKEEIEDSLEINAGEVPQTLRICKKQEESRKEESEEKLEQEQNEELVKVKVNCVESVDVIGDVNSVVRINDQKEFLSSQSLMTNNEEETVNADSYQSLKENVQAVPNETAQTRLKTSFNQQPLKMPVDERIGETSGFIRKMRRPQRTQRNNPRNSNNDSSKCRESFNSRNSCNCLTGSSWIASLEVLIRKSSNMEVGSSSFQDKSANGPI